MDVKLDRTCVTSISLEGGWGFPLPGSPKSSGLILGPRHEKLKNVK